MNNLQVSIQICFFLVHSYYLTRVKSSQVVSFPFAPFSCIAHCRGRIKIFSHLCRSIDYYYASVENLASKKPEIASTPRIVSSSNNNNNNAAIPSEREAAISMISKSKEFFRYLQEFLQLARAFLSRQKESNMKKQKKKRKKERNGNETQ